MDSTLNWIKGAAQTVSYRLRMAMAAQEVLSITAGAPIYLLGETYRGKGEEADAEALALICAASTNATALLVAPARVQSTGESPAAALICASSLVCRGNAVEPAGRQSSGRQGSACCSTWSRVRARCSLRRCA